MLNYHALVMACRKNYNSSPVTLGLITIVSSFDNLNPYSRFEVALNLEIREIILSTSHYQSMIMQHLLNENTYKKLESYIDNKIQSNLLWFLRQHKMCFAEPKWKFLNDMHNQVRSFDKLPKIHIFTVKQQTQNDMFHLRQTSYGIV